MDLKYLILSLVALLTALWFLPSSWYKQPIWVHHYSTKTAYRNHAYNPSSSFINDATKSLSSKDCHPVHVSAVYRHGTRYPTAKDIQKVSDLHERLLNDSDVLKKLPQSLLNWKNPFPIHEERNLADEGKREMWAIGRRMRDQWSQRLSSSSNENPFRVDNTRWFSSSKSRSRESGAHFAMGLLPEEISAEKQGHKLLQDDDKHMRFFDYCDAYNNLVEENKTSQGEIHQFKEGPEVRSVIQSIRKRLGLGDTFPLDAGDVKAIFVYCAEEVATKTQKKHPGEEEEHDSAEEESEYSPWCSLFTETQRRIMEYWHDLKCFWRKSYGYHVNYHPSCLLLHRLTKLMEEAIYLEDKAKSERLLGTFSFGHAETIMPLAAVLGLFDEKEPLLANNYIQHLWRNFKTSAMTPFAGNLAFVLHHCKAKPAKESVSDMEYRVQLLLNELPIEWPEFRGRTDISWTEFKKHYHFCWEDNFDFKQSCSVKSTKSRHPLSNTEKPAS